MGLRHRIIYLTLYIPIKQTTLTKNKLGESSVSMNLLNSLLVDLAYVYILTCNSADRATSREKECTWKKQSRPITSLLGCCP